MNPAALSLFPFQMRVRLFKCEFITMIYWGKAESFDIKRFASRVPNLFRGPHFVFSSCVYSICIINLCDLNTVSKLRNEPGQG
jgi:hypothetical protein